MEKPERDAEQSTPQYSAPILPENAGKAYVAIPEPQPFTATLRERLLALLIYIPAYLYCCSWIRLSDLLCVLYRHDRVAPLGGEAQP